MSTSRTQEINCMAMATPKKIRDCVSTLSKSSAMDALMMICIKEERTPEKPIPIITAPKNFVGNGPARAFVEDSQSVTEIPPITAMTMIVALAPASDVFATGTNISTRKSKNGMINPTMRRGRRGMLLPSGVSMKASPTTCVANVTTL
ncbi:hypothetical protein DQ04_23791000 [Trypanosoma grayi]|uniref:hypothetical protein n=1 Tax=Trypanosoma grayi TaxID=71804 RepID=UPI0004F496A8|nr:hypothetical protein DQ04_23791000 [Trypanosoma grayi]KEG05304.1 hypothetical protein DQ04_23791000 [Trypanosoma grayi]